MAHPVEIRQKALDYLERCKNVIEVAKVFGISRSTLYQWKTKKETTGQIKHSSGGLRHMKIDREKLSAYVEKRPDAYLHEIASEFNCSVSAVFYALRSLGFTYKKDHKL